jgi:hypothetical protein
MRVNGSGPARRVIIATPAHDRKTFADYTYSYGETIRLGAEAGILIRGLLWPGESLVQVARNKLLKRAIEVGVDDLLFIDADQAWDAGAALRLLSHPVDCVGFPVVKKENDGEAYNVRLPGYPVPRCPTTGLLEVLGIGTGFLRLTRKAMLALWNASEEYVDDFGHRDRWIFPVGPVSGRLVSEDMAASFKLRQAGIKVYADPSFTCEHAGPKVWRGDFAAYLAKIEAAAARQAAAAPLQ